jgi:hypothetical protein
MLNRPAVQRDKRVERQSATDASELDRGLEAAIRKSEQSLSAKIEDLINKRYRVIAQTDR